MTLRFDIFDSRIKLSNQCIDQENIGFIILSDAHRLDVTLNNTDLTN